MIAVVYLSRTGNTEKLARCLTEEIRRTELSVELFRLEEFDQEKIDDLDGLAAGTFTWGSGDIPESFLPLLDKISEKERDLVTGVFGTGDSFYPHFCGAVTQLQKTFFRNTDLAASLKVELAPQRQDRERCRKFAEVFKHRVRKQLSRQ
ncbi:MAG: flavodoxin [Alkalicoccus sp.]|nr:MAG: flavodoxin [Alkalicoccus sp.]